MARIAKVIFLLSLLSSTPSYSFFDPPPEARDLEFFLLTVDVGSGLEKRFGHSILRVSNKKSTEDFLLNWGTFDFGDPNFLWNFVRAKLRYWVSESNLRSALRYYRDVEERSVVQEKLNLTLQQKQHLLKLVEFKLEPEQKFFWYNFFYKNCSTILRDLLDEILGGQVASATHQWPATLKLRTQVRQSLNEWFVVGFFTDLMMNAETDQKIDAWVEMFHPLLLREHLLRLPQFDDQARPILGTKLLSETKQMVKGGEYPSSTVNFYHWVLAFGLSFLLLSLVLQKKSARFSSILLRSFSVIWGLLSSLIGWILLLGWVISDYSCLHHNANLWLFWPSDILLPFIAWRYPNLGIKAKAYLWAHSVSLGVFLACYALAVIEQDVSNAVKFLCPVLGLYLFIFLKVRKRPL